MIQPDYKEALRYLGYQKIEPTPEIEEMMHVCMQDLLRQVHMKSVYRRFPITYMEEGVIETASMHIESQDLYRNLKGCTDVYLMAATLGVEADRLIKRAEITNMTKAAVYQACGASLIETYVDMINQKIKEEEAVNHRYLRPRFSCGYGDFALEHQKDFIRILEMPRTIGVTLTDTLLMVPVKSVTAVIGVSQHDEKCTTAGCEACGKTDCTFRRSTI